MRVSEEAVFRWVLIIGVVVAFLVAVTLLTTPLVGAVLLGLFMIAGCFHAYRWAVRKRRESRD